MTYRKKMIEVALPLDKINAAAAREKSIRHGHPSTLHLWWARRPLAAARAVIFAQMVDDPSSCPEEFPTEAEQDVERDRLFSLLSELVLWENTTNESLLERARAEIRRSWAREHIGSAVKGLTDKQIVDKLETEEIPPLPGFHDPFAGGGALPLEAQRLGLESYASDLNPVAVIINKAMIEIPPKFAGMPPVNPEAQNGELIKKSWNGTEGLAADVRYYGKWMRDEAQKRIGHLYPKAKVTTEMSKERPDLKQYENQELTVIAWIWARTVRSPNPAFHDVNVPLISTYVLSSKKGKEAWLEPIIEGNDYRFKVRTGKFPPEAKNGTKLGRGANFRCLLSSTPLGPEHIKTEGCSGRMGARLTAIVCEGERGRVYLPASEEHERIAKSAMPTWEPEQELPDDPRNFWTPPYGLTSYRDLFTSRQLTGLICFSDLITEAQNEIAKTACSTIFSEDDRPLRAGGVGLKAYAETVSLYLGFAVDKIANLGSAITSWMGDRGAFRETFARQSLPMAWDFSEANFFSNSGGNFTTPLEKGAKTIEYLPCGTCGESRQEDATSQKLSEGRVVSTDPPYYDNINYSDLSDFFYVWLRRCFQPMYPNLFATLTVPKQEELVATPYRHGGKANAEKFFMDGMTKAIHNLVVLANQSFPVTIYYAFKQSESRDGDTASTGWETFLEAVLSAGFSICGTWPMRTEGAGRIIGIGTNALASSIVLVCRQRPHSAGMTSRRDFQRRLRAELPVAMEHLQHGNIAPVDLAQSSIGPGMGIFSEYSKVVEADGSPMKVRTALALINEVLDEILTEQEGEMDGDTRWAVAWFEQFGFGHAPFGRADDLSKAKNTSVQGLVDAGIVESGGGNVRLLTRDELEQDWNPATDKRSTVWEATQHLIRRLQDEGEESAAQLLKQLGGVAEEARALSYRLYQSCERKGRAEEAGAYNSLVIAWPELSRLSASVVSSEPSQGELF